MAAKARADCAVVAATVRASPRLGATAASSTGFLAIATTYSTPASSSRSKIAGLAKPASRHTRTAAPGKACQSFGRSRRRRRQEPAEETGDTDRGRRRARPKDCGHQVLPRLVVEREEGHQREVAPAAVEAIEERQLLRPMRRVFGEIEIHRDTTHAATALAMVGNDRVGEGLSGDTACGPRRCSQSARASAVRPGGRR